jgi:hypothetical protein
VLRAGLASVDTDDKPTHLFLLLGAAEVRFCCAPRADVFLAGIGSVQHVAGGKRVLPPRDRTFLRAASSCGKWDEPIA